MVCEKAPVEASTMRLRVLEAPGLYKARDDDEAKRTRLTWGSLELDLQSTLNGGIWDLSTPY